MDFSLSPSNSNLPKKYKKDFEHSYALGPFPTFELLNNSPERALAVYIDESFNEREKLEALCAEKTVPFFYSRRALERISNKEVCYAAAVFSKCNSKLVNDKAHIALVNPADMGNLGTILRTALAFNIKNIAIVEPAADFWNPKTVRASMGAVFRMNIESFKSFEEYIERFPERDLFPFMLDGGLTLTPQSCPKSSSYTLVFGNESSGLPSEYQNLGQSVFIEQSDEVDSLNLSISVAIGTYIFKESN